MFCLTMRIERLRDRLLALRNDQRGVSAVEFAMLLPLMVTLYLGGIEVSQGVSIDRKVSIAARAVADLAAQDQDKIVNTEMTNILSAGKSVVAPYPESKLKLTVSSVKIDGNKKATIAWSDAFGATAKTPTTDVTTLIPEPLRIANSSLIWAEASFSYQPTIGYVVTGSMNLKDQIFMRPRLVDQVCRDTGTQTLC
jgi:Flp pilus assembly protein TadG